MRARRHERGAMGATPTGGDRRVSNDPPTAGQWRPTEAPSAAAAGSSMVGVENSGQRGGVGGGGVTTSAGSSMVGGTRDGRPAPGRKGAGVPAIKAATAAWATPLGGGLV